MTSPDHITSKVEAALDSLDTLQRAKANPFLYSRVRAAMGNAPESLWGLDFFLRPSVAVAAAVLIGFLNGLVFLPGANEETVAFNQEDELSSAASYNFNKTGDESIYSLLEEEQP
jgi:hypothetical protein